MGIPIQTTSPKKLHVASHFLKLFLSQQLFRVTLYVVLVAWVSPPKLHQLRSWMELPTYFNYSFSLRVASILALCSTYSNQNQLTPSCTHMEVNTNTSYHLNFRFSLQTSFQFSFSVLTFKSRGEGRDTFWSKTRGIGITGIPCGSRRIPLLHYYTALVI